MTLTRTLETSRNAILIFGPPGSGKGTWGKIIGMMPGFYHLSTGDMFRTMNTESEVGRKVMEVIRRGELVPDDIVFDLGMQHINNAALVGSFRPEKDILLLDGFPRTPTQAEMLRSLAEIKGVLLLDCKDREILIERLHKRAVLEERADDASEKIIRRRFEVYEKEIKQTISKLEHHLVEKIDASADPVYILCAIGQALAKFLN